MQNFMDMMKYKGRLDERAATKMRMELALVRMEQEDKERESTIQAAIKKGNIV